MASSIRDVEGGAGLSVLEQRGRDRVERRAQGRHADLGSLHRAGQGRRLVEVVAGAAHGLLELRRPSDLVTQLLAELDHCRLESGGAALRPGQLGGGGLPPSLGVGHVVGSHQVGGRGGLGVVAGAAHRARLVVLEPTGQLAGHGVEPRLAAVLVDVAQVLGGAALRGHQRPAGRLSLERLVEAAPGREDRPGTLETGRGSLDLRRALLGGSQGCGRLDQLGLGRSHPLSGLLDPAGLGRQVTAQDPQGTLSIVDRCTDAPGDRQ